MARNAKISRAGGHIALLILQGALVPAALAAPANYHTVQPCRVFDSRRPADGPALSSGVVRTITVAGVCGVAQSATSVTVNLAVTQPTSLGLVRLFASGPVPPSPFFSLNYSAGQTRGNNAMVQLSASGQADALVSMTSPGTVHLIVDVFGYFLDDAPPTAAADSETVSEDASPTTIDVLANDTDPDGGPISVSSVTQPANGTVAITNGGANLTYRPAPDYCNAPPGTTPDAFTYTLWPGGSTATVSVIVQCVNDAPRLGGAGTVAFTEGGLPVAVAPALTVADVDDVDLASARVTITNLLDPGAERLAADTTGTSITAAYTAPTLVLTGADTVANYRLVLRRVTYENTSVNPDTHPRQVAFLASDGSLDSSPAVATVVVNAVNGAPVLAAGSGSPTFTEDGGAVVLQPGLAVTDPDDANLESAKVTITNLLDGGAETLAATTAGTSIAASYIAPTLTLTGSDTLARYQAVLRSVVYANSSQGPSATARSIAFVANDGSANSNTLVTSLTVTPVNDVPVLTPSGGSPTFAENGPPVAVDPALGVADPDDVNLESARVTITNLLDAGAETLAASTAGTSIQASFTAPTLTLSGTDTRASYQAVLRSVTYLNSSDTPHTTPRLVEVVANDGALDSNPVVKTLSVVSVDDAPVLSAGGVSPTFTEDGAPVGVDAGLAVADVDDTNLESATVTITNLLNTGAETLAASTAGTSISASYAAPTLTLAGSDTLAHYQAVLRSVTYGNTSQNPGTVARSVAFRVNDGTDSSNVVAMLVNMVAVNDAPVVAGAGTVTFVEDAGPVAAAAGLVVTDVDAANLASAAVTITNLLDAGFEALTANTAGTSITATYAAPILTLTGADTVAHYQAVLRSVAYNNGSNTPNPANRGVAYAVNDGSANSNTAVATVQVVAVNDPPTLTTNPISYATVGNTQLHVAGKALPGVASIADPQSAVAKSSPLDADGPVAPTVVAASGTSANGGTFAIDADGSFTYVPPLDFTGTDSFPYQVTDTLAASTGTVNVSVSSVVWYVRDVIDANNPAGGDGRSTNAFETLAPAQAASLNGHFIFVFAGSTATTPLAGGVVLKDGQKLYGEGVGLSVPGFAHLVAAGNRPVISNGAGDAVSVPATTGNRNGVEIRGLDLRGTGNAVDVTATGANAVGVVITDNSLLGSFEEGVDLNAGSTGLFTAVVQDNTILAGGPGLDARTSAAGQLRVDFSRNTVASGSNAVVIDGSGGGTTTITGFASNVVTGNSAAAGLVVNAATFDATPGALPLDTVSGGNTRIGMPLDGVGGAGMVLTNVTGSLAFTGLDLYADGGGGLRVSGTGAFTGTTGTRVSVTAGVGNIGATGGPALDLAALTADLPLASLRSTNSTSTGVSLAGVSGTISAAAGSILTAGSTAFAINGGTANVSYGGTITDSFGPLVTVANTTGGSKTFSGKITDGDAGTGGGISLANNPGAIVNFLGGLVLSTGGNPAFTATGGGTVNVCDDNPCAAGAGPLVNTLTTTTATALDVRNTTIGADGLAFRSISSNGAPSGVVLDDTGALAGLTVSGTGTPGSGGTIQGSTGPGIVSRNTRSFSLTGLGVKNGGDDGIRVLGDGNASVSIRVSSCTFENNRGDHFRAATTATNTVTMDVLFQGNTLVGDGGVTHGGDDLGGGVTINPAGAAQVAFNVFGNSIQGATSSAISIKLGANPAAATPAARLSGTVSGNVIGTDGVPGSGSSQGDGITVSSSGEGTTTVAITNNTIRQHNHAGIDVVQRDGDGALEATVTGNTISNPGALATNAILGQAGAVPTDQGVLCFDIGGTGPLGNSFAGAGANGATDFRVDQGNDTTIRLPGYNGPPSVTASVVAFVKNRNNGSPSGSATVGTVPPAGGFVGGAACLQP
jgi:hypothetical protein